MELHKRLANEQFFMKILDTLSENGLYCVPATNPPFHFKKRNNKLEAQTQTGYDWIRGIVTPEFFKQKVCLPEHYKTLWNR